MRPIYQPLKTLGLIAGQPRVQRLARHPTFDATCEIANPSLITANTACYRCSATLNSLI